MKLDVFDAITGLFLAIFALLVAIDVVTWIVRQVRSGSLFRRLRGLEPEEELPPPNAGFSLGDSARHSASRRHFTRDQNAQLLPPRLGASSAAGTASEGRLDRQG